MKKKWDMRIKREKETERKNTFIKTLRERVNKFYFTYPPHLQFRYESRKVDYHQSFQRRRTSLILQTQKIIKIMGVISSTYRN